MTHYRYFPPPPEARARVSLMRRAATAIGIAAALALVPLQAASAHTTQGNATPGNDGWHPWPSDRCSTPGANTNAVRGIFDFGHACVHHDGCYIGFPRNGRPTNWATRAQCDSWFLYDMQASCRYLHGANPAANWASGLGR